MPTPDLDLFTRLGLHVRQDFLGAAECAAPAREGRVSEPESDVLRADVRRTLSARADSSDVALVGSRLASARPEFERHFRLELGRYESPRFLVREEGGFYLKHRDSREGLTRRVSIVLLLNGQAAADADGPPAPGTYSGGALSPYGLAPDPRLENIGFPLAGPARRLPLRPGPRGRARLAREALHRVSWFH